MLRIAVESGQEKSYDVCPRLTPGNIIDDGELLQVNMANNMFEYAMLCVAQVQGRVLSQRHLRYALARTYSSD